MSQVSVLHNSFEQNKNILNLNLTQSHGNHLVLSTV